MPASSLLRGSRKGPLARVRSSAVLGIDAYRIDVEVDVSYGFPGFAIVGLPDAAVNESKERVRAAIKNSGLFFPYDKRCTVNRQV